MVPANPVANFVVRHFGFSLAAIEALLHSMSGLGDAAKLFMRCRDVCVAQVIILFGNSTVPITMPNHDKCFVRGLRLAAMSCLNAAFQDLHHKRTFLPIANINALPHIVRLFDRPFVNSHRTSGSTAISFRCIRLF